MISSICYKTDFIDFRLPDDDSNVEIYKYNFFLVEHIKTFTGKLYFGKIYFDGWMMLIKSSNT